MYSAIYSVVRYQIDDAFEGMIGDFDGISIYRLSLFLSTETSTGLGTGAIFANNVSWIPFFLVAINSVQLIVASSFAWSSLVIVLRPSEYIPSLKNYMEQTGQNINSQLDIGRRLRNLHNTFDSLSDLEISFDTSLDNLINFESTLLPVYGKTL